MPSSLKFFDFFCGAGGLSLGLKAAGLRPVGGLDINRSASKTYRSNFGVKVLQRNAFKVDLKELVEEFDVDMLVGCPPCQGFSRLRMSKSQALNDPRNDLILVFAEAIKVFKPKYVLFENVPRVVRDSRFKKLLNTLEREEYFLSYTILNAADYGVPQRRRRLILIASQEHPVEFPEREYGPPNSKEVRRGDLLPWKTVRDAIGDLPPVRPGEADPRDPLHRAKRLPEHWLKLIRAIPKNGGSRLDAPEELWLPAHRRCGKKCFADVFGRLYWEKPAPTITTGFYDPSKGRFVHPEQDRGLTLREGARLQTFPDNFKFYGSFTQIARQIGEAFPPLLAKKLVKNIR